VRPLRSRLMALTPPSLHCALSERPSDSRADERKGRAATTRRRRRRTAPSMTEQPPRPSSPSSSFRTGAATLAIRTSALRLCNRATRSARPIRLLSAPCLGPPASTLTVARAREQASTTPTTSLPSWNATSRRLVAGETAGSSPTGHSRSDCPSPRRAVAAPMRPLQAWSSSAWPSWRPQGAPCVRCRTGILAPAPAVSVCAGPGRSAYARLWCGQGSRRRCQREAKTGRNTG